MVVRLLMVALFLAIVSAFAMPETLLTRATLSAVLATAVLGAAIFTSSRAIVRFAQLLRPLLVLTLLAPAIWMALQLVPIPIRGLGNPIWATASIALNEPLAERLTVDVRATMLAATHYSAVIALALLSAVVALDRQRAAQLLDGLVLTTTFVCAYSIWRYTGGLDAFSRNESALTATNGAVPAVLGLLLSAAMVVRTIDQIRRVRKPSGFALAPVTKLSLALLAMLICLVAILVRSSSSIAIAALLGAGLLFTVFAIRKWFYRIWGMAGVLATAAVVFLASLTFVPMKKNTDLTVALSMQDHTATERMLQDAGLAGSGAGAYAVLLPIHRDIGTMALRERPTAAAAIAIEMGRTFLVGLLIVAVLVAATLFSRSLLRGYDYVYAATGAAASVAMAVLALVEDGILDFGASLLAAVLYGLAFAQSPPSTAGEITYSGSPNGANNRDSTGLPMRAGASGSASTRLALGALAIVLVAQSAWLLTDRRYQGSLPIGSPAISDSLFGTISRAASNPPARDNGVRERQLAAAAKIETDETDAPGQQGRTRRSALNVFAEPLRYSPMRSDLWLMLAAMSKEYQSTTYDAVALLKLSYYTAPNDLDLLPLRLSVALGTSAAIREPELRELIKRDIKIAVTDRPALKPAIAAAYRSASVDGRTFADSLLSELDPSYLQSMGVRRP